MATGLANLKNGESWDARTIPLRRAGAIAGVVRDEFGEPIAGLTVSASRIVYSPPGSRSLVPMKTAVTNDLGEYRVFGLEPGTYYLEAARYYLEAGNRAGAGARALGSDQGLAPAYFPSAHRLSEAQPIRLAPGEDRRGVDIARGFAPLWRVSGRVTMADGTPSRNATVTLVPAGEEGSSRRISGRIDGNGAFSIASVPAGSYLAVVPPQQPGTMVTLQGAKAVETWVTTSLTESASVPLDVAGDVAGLEIRTSRGFDIRGRVLLDGRPPTAEVSKRLLVGVLTSAGYVSHRPATSVEPSGNFVITGLQAGRARLSVDGLPTDAFLSRVSVNGHDVTDDGFEMSAPVIGIEIALTTNSAVITGAVTSPVGERVYGVILVFSENNRFWTIPATRYLKMSTASVSGEFKINKLPAGRYLAVALASSDPFAWADPENLAELRKTATPFTVPESGTVTLNLVRR